jgi:[protein-PII] uridylyltransferase
VSNPPHSHPSQALPATADDLRDFKSLRRAWQAELEPRLRAGEAGQSLSAWLADRWDALLADAFARELRDDAPFCGLYALGGYGRRSMAPFSDVDLMILVPDGAPGRLLGAVERLINALWSAGVKLGHSVRTRQQCLDLAAEDTSVATSLLDARAIAAPPEGALDVAAVVREALGGEGAKRFAELVRQGVRHRRQKFGDSAHLLEPQVKQGRGGLRDLHALFWSAHVLFGASDLDALVAKGVVGAAEAGRLEAAHSFVLRTRMALHLHHGWKQDSLTYAAQGQVAALLGFGEQYTGASINRLMQAYYLHAHRIATISDLWLEEWTREGDADGALALPTHAAGELGRDPQAIWALLERALEAGRRLHPSVRRALAEVAPRLPVSVALDGEANRVMRRVICSLDDPHDLLQTVADTGLLARVVPEWAHLTAHAQHDTYHVYTTDVHLLVTCRRIKALIRGELQRRSPYLSGLAHRYASRLEADALLLATLLHDVGKGLSGDHSIVGAGMATEVAFRMQLSAEDQQLVRELVVEHLTMPRVSQRRDLQDPTTLDVFCRRVGRPELLDALTLLSFADMDSVGPGHLNDWKLSLLTELHRQASAHLREEGRVRVPRAQESWELVRSVLEGDASEEELSRLEQRLPKRLLGSAPVPQLVRSARLLLDSDGSPRVAFHDAPGGHLTEVLVYEPVHPGRFADVAAVLDAAGLDIHRARSSPLGEAGTLEIFEVRTADAAHRAIPERRRESLAAEIVAVVSGELEVDELIARKLRQSRLPPRQRPNVTTSVFVDNEFDPAFTIVEVKAPDAPGLLAHLTRALRDLAVQVDRSIITTEGDRAIDTFYVVDREGHKLSDAASLIARQTILASIESR